MWDSLVRLAAARRFRTSSPGPTRHSTVEQGFGPLLTSRWSFLNAPAHPRWVRVYLEEFATSRMGLFPIVTVLPTMECTTLSSRVW
jgi:hypothetical protein